MPYLSFLDSFPTLTNGRFESYFQMQRFMGYNWLVQTANFFYAWLDKSETRLIFWELFFNKEINVNLNDKRGY